MSERNARDVLKALGIDWTTASLDFIRTSYIRDLRDKAAGRGGDEQMSLAAARAEEATVNAALRRLDFHARLGELVPANDAEEALRDWAGYANREIATGIDKLVLLIENEHRITIDRDHVKSVSGPTIDRIRGYAERIGRGLVEGGGGIRSAEEDSDSRLAD